MKSIVGTKSLTFVLGISLCGVTGYLLYLLFKNDDDNDYQSTLPSTAKFKTSEVLVPKDCVRAIIGRNGRNIKQIQEQSNTRINFREAEPDSDVRICVVRGSVEGCNVAEHLISELLCSQPLLECAYIWVPQSAVGKIIGRSGENIQEIINITGAQINVVDGDRNTLTRKIAIKGTKDQINLAKCYIDEIVEKYLNSKANLDAALAKREPRLPLKMAGAAKSPVEGPRVERISPTPGQSDSPFEVYVSAMIDPSRFWVQIVGPKATELDLLVEEMTEYYRKSDNRDSHQLINVEPGDLVAATFQYDNKWYRAEVLNVSKEDTEHRAELYYVDYGDTDTVPCKELCELRTDFLRLHFQAIECFLAKVDPVGESWCEDAVDKFEEWTHVAQWQKLSAKINGYCVREKTRAKREGSPVPGVDLFDVSNDKDVDIAQELVRQGYAVMKKESERSSRATSISNVSVESSTLWIDYQKTLPSNTKFKTSEILVPKDFVQVIIGRNGRNIKQIQEQSNTLIIFRDAEPNAEAQICVVRGSVEGCNKAERLINQLLCGQPNCIDIWVPQSAFAKVIGRNGENIPKIIKITGAQIDVIDGDRNTLTRRITIKGGSVFHLGYFNSNVPGTKDQMNLAKSYFDKLVEKYLNSKENLENLDAALAKCEPRLPFKMVGAAKIPVEGSRVGRLSLTPSQSDSSFEVYLSAMIDPSKFWVQIVSPKAAELDSLVEEMTEYYRKTDNRDSHQLLNVEPGELVAAIFQYDNKWYRAEILTVSKENTEHQAELFYVDYGDIDTVPCKELCKLHTDFLRLHFQAIECFLAKVEPVGDSWCEDAIDKFEEWTHVAQWQKLSAKINGYCVREKTRAKRVASPVPGLDLFDVSNDKDVAEELVRQGYAVMKKENEWSSLLTSNSDVSFKSSTHLFKFFLYLAKMNGYCFCEKTLAKIEGSPIPEVDLLDVSNNKDVDIAQELVRQDYAVIKKESKLSRSWPAEGGATGARA